MREFKERENYVIKVDGELVKVSREVYETYHRMERRERYLVERDQDNSLILFSTLRAEDSSTDVPIKDSGVDVEEEVIQKIFLDKLPKALALLTDDEIEMIRDLYWKGMSIRELAKKTDTAKSTLLNVIFSFFINWSPLSFHAVVYSSHNIIIQTLTSCAGCALNLCFVPCFDKWV